CIALELAVLRAGGLAAHEAPPHHARAFLRQQPARADRSGRAVVVGGTAGPDHEPRAGRGTRGEEETDGEQRAAKRTAAPRHAGVPPGARAPTASRTRARPCSATRRTCSIMSLPL